MDMQDIVPIDAELPRGFDSPPRRAAIEAVEEAGLEVVTCSSGWGGRSTDEDEALIDEICGEAYVAGLMDAPQEGTA